MFFVCFSTHSSFSIFFPSLFHCVLKGRMQYYEVDPLVSIHVDDVVNTFYPSRIDNTKLMIGGKNCWNI